MRQYGQAARLRNRSLKTMLLVSAALQESKNSNILGRLLARAHDPLNRSKVASVNSATLHASRTTNLANSGATPVGSVRP